MGWRDGKGQALPGHNVDVGNQAEITQVDLEWEYGGSTPQDHLTNQLLKELKPMFQWGVLATQDFPMDTPGGATLLGSVDGS